MVDFTVVLEKYTDSGAITTENVAVSAEYFSYNEVNDAVAFVEFYDSEERTTVFDATNVRQINRD